MKLPDDWSEQIKATYPKRMGHQGWEKLRVLVPRLAFTWGIPWETILKAAQNYRLMNDRLNKTGSEFVMPAAKFYDDRDQLFAEYAEMDMRTPQEIAQDAKWEALEARAKALGFNEVDRSRGYETAVNAVVQAERDAQQKLWRERGMDQPKFGRAS